jgi:hypothetical protein
MSGMVDRLKGLSAKLWLFLTRMRIFPTRTVVGRIPD